MTCWKTRQAIEEIVASGKQVLPSRYRQAIEPIRELAAATSMPLCKPLDGGDSYQLRRFNSIAKYKNTRMEDGSLDKMHGKESAAIKRQMTRMNRDLRAYWTYRDCQCLVRDWLF